MQREYARAKSAPPESLAIRTGELIVVIASVLAVTILVWNRQHVPDWWPAAGWFTAIGAMPLVLRALCARYPQNRSIRFVADMSIIVAMFGFYMNLNPVLDAVNMGIADDYLIRADQRLFGMQLSVALQHVVPSGLNDLFMVAYSTHFFWPLVLGLVLWFRREEEKFDEWATALMFFFAANYAFYCIVPAMGPRYFQSAWFDTPITGTLAHPIELFFRASPMGRDCFPSGHTGVALLVLFYAWRWVKPLFFVAFPVLICLISATLVGRFHYGIDLVAAIPLMGLSVAVAKAMTARLPEGFVVFDRVRAAAMLASVRRAWDEVRGQS